MDPSAFDPYEQELHAVFKSYDINNTGNLDHQGFSQLCSTLQLEERRADLMFYLFDSTGKNTITFYDFKEALLTMLGEENIENEQHSVHDDECSDREVSPKYVYGAKKYGRRTRPRVENDDDRTSCTTESKLTSEFKINKIQRSNSQSDIQPSKKRKGNTQLKRCTSFPNATNYQKIDSPLSTPSGMVSELWQTLNIGKNGALNSKELKLVIDYIGMDKISDNVINQLHTKLNLSDDKQLSFNSFVELLHSCDLFQSDIINNVQNSQMFAESESFQKTDITQLISFDKDGAGIISASVIVDMWENAGISSAHSLLADLGFNQDEINITKLVQTIDGELQNINGDLNQISITNNPHLALLQASLALYQLEVRCLKSAIEHLNCERDKLKIDVNDANYRANLLAQEVDDNHTKMEKKTKEHVKLLEQRHADIIRELSEQLTNEREQTSLLSHKLEQRIASLEAEELKLKTELASVQHDVVDLEKENHNLLEQITQLEQTNTQLLENVTTLEGEKQEICATENTRKDKQILSYLEKITSLQIENTSLKDKNDELCSELESLSVQLSALQIKKSHATTSRCTLNGSVDTSSQNCVMDSPPNNDPNTSSSTSSSSKYKKCHIKNNISELADGLNVMSFNANDTGLDIDYDYTDSSVSIESNDGNDEPVQNGDQELPINCDPDLASKQTVMDKENAPEQQLTEKLKERCEQLELILYNTKVALHTVVSDKNCDIYKCISDIYDKLSENMEFIKKLSKNKADITTSNSNSLNSNMNDENDEKNDEIERLQAENKELEKRCYNLEISLDLLKSEYEHCEDYWANKLDEERQLFDQEQKQSNLNFQELLNRMTELEEQFSTQDNKLPVIQENNFEKQFTELEEDFESYKKEAEKQLECQRNEIENYKLIIDNLSKKNCELTNVNTQTTNIPTLDKEINTEVTISRSNTSDLFNMVATNSFQIQNASSVHRTHRKHSTSSSEISYRKDEIKRLRNIKSQLDTECQTLHKQKDNLIREMIELKNKSKDVDEPVYTFKWKGMRGFTNLHSAKQICRVSIGTLQELNARIHDLDQKCRHLQHLLRKNQQQTENMLHQCWLQHKGEVTDLQYLLKNLQEKLDYQTHVANEHMQRLTKSDMLIKDLYVENSYLVATLQRLEHHCHQHLSSQNNKINNPL